MVRLMCSKIFENLLNFEHLLYKYKYVKQKWTQTNYEHGLFPRLQQNPLIKGSIYMLIYPPRCITSHSRTPVRIKEMETENRHPTSGGNCNFGVVPFTWGGWPGLRQYLIIIKHTWPKWVEKNAWARMHSGWFRESLAHMDEANRSFIAMHVNFKPVSHVQFHQFMFLSGGHRVFQFYVVVGSAFFTGFQDW